VRKTLPLHSPGIRMTDPEICPTEIPICTGVPGPKVAILRVLLLPLTMGSKELWRKCRNA